MNNDIERIKSKLINDWTDKEFYDKVFDELSKAKFERLSFLSNIMKEWDLSHLTGYPSIIANSVLSLDRKTDELNFYKDLFKQLDKDKLIHFLACAVYGKELDESVIDKIVPTFSDEQVNSIIIESMNAKIVDEKEDCAICNWGNVYARQACFLCAKKMLQTGKKYVIPSRWDDMHCETSYFCGCRARLQSVYDMQCGRNLSPHEWPCNYHKN